jgi:hypothetical protein
MSGIFVKRLVAPLCSFESLRLRGFKKTNSLMIIRKLNT